MDRKDFTVEFDDSTLAGDILPADAVPEIVFLHGAGKADRRRYDFLRDPLAKDGIASCAFDFIGHGEMGGSLERSSLAQRTDQATAVIDSLALPEPFGIVAGSMSAYTAIILTQFYEIDRMVLMVPAVYDEKVYSWPFNQDFSESIRQPKSWESSDAWDILSTYPGKLLIVAADKDEVIPQELPDRLYEAARHASSRELYVVEGAPHSIQSFLTDPANQKDFDKIYDKIKEVLSWE